MRSTFAALCFLLSACANTPEVDSRFGSSWPLVYSQDFTEGEFLKHCSFSDQEAWRWAPPTTGVPGFLELVGNSGYQPPHRSPKCIALLHDRAYQSFVLEAKILQTGADGAHRDFCLFFGFQDPSNYYYVHMATRPDDHAHNIFRVENAPRVKTSPVAAAGIDWGRDIWHDIRLERDADQGLTRVYFDDMQTPALSSTDATFSWGLLGFGSFDDSGRVTDVNIWAPETVEPLPGAREPFRRPDKR